MRILFLSLMALMFLSGCAQTQLASHLYKKLPGSQNPQGTFKVGNPYKVEGKWYQPQETYNYTETGVASWYGAQFHGRKTANGERFDKHELTAAHRTLQMPSLVRVTNLDNGRSLVVRINDRGPFKRGRVIDVSERAAELLGFKGLGTAKVRLDLLADESKTLAMAARGGQSTEGMEVAMADHMPPSMMDGGAPLTEPVYEEISYQAAAPVEPIVQGHLRDGEFMPDAVVSQLPVRPTSLYVQAGSFSNPANAQSLADKLRPFGPAQVYPTQVNGQPFYRVRLGPIERVNQADSMLARIGSAGYKQAIIVVD
jgi:rare lipoprotein A